MKVQVTITDSKGEEITKTEREINVIASDALWRGFTDQITKDAPDDYVPSSFFPVKPHTVKFVYGENQMPSTTIQYFDYDHLPAKLQEISKTIYELAHLMENTLPDGPEKSAGMRKLLEAKDCFVRSVLPVKRD